MSPTAAWGSPQAFCAVSHIVATSAIVMPAMP